VYVLMLVWNRVTKKPVSYRGKHVVITGGSEGLGRALGELLLERGAKVTLIARTKSKLDEAEKELSPKGEVQVVVADVGDYAVLEKGIRAAEAKFGPCQFMIPCAGFAQPGYIEDTPVEVYEKQMRVNYLGSVNAVKAVLPGMQQRREGYLVLVTSVLGLLSMPGYSAYCPSKYALRAFADCLRFENLRYNIKTSIFFPGNMDTPGYVLENQTKPPLTKKLEDAGQLYTSRQAAEQLVGGLDRGHYRIVPDFQTLLIVPTGGFAPRTHFLTEMLLSTIIAPITAVFRLYWDHLSRNEPVKSK